MYYIYHIVSRLSIDTFASAARIYKGGFFIMATPLFQQKYDNFMKAIHRQEPDYVPTAITNNGGGFFWAGKTAFDVAGDHEAYAEAISSFMGETWIDANILSGLTTTPRLDKAFPTKENKLAENGTLTHLQVPPMKDDEYDQLIADPARFIKNVLLPRKYPEMFTSREKAREMLKVFAEEYLDTLVLQMQYTNKYIAEKYGVYTCCNISCMLDTPLDHIFDFFRGFSGTRTDLRRHKAQIKPALDAIWEYQEAPLLTKPYDASKGFPFQPCHIPAYLSPKQYKELYWPYEQKLIEWVYNSGSKIFIILEGRWENIWDCFKEIPKDSVVLAVDDDDIFKAHEALGDYQIICGGLKMAETRLKTFEMMKDDVKRVIDVCAPGGGFFYTADKGVLTPGDVNQTLLDCFNFAHEYSKK